MMSSVPSADVIITNPTHYAVALSYDNIKIKHQLLFAKGIDFIALRIKEVEKIIFQLLKILTCKKFI